MAVTKTPRKKPAAAPAAEAPAPKAKAKARPAKKAAEGESAAVEKKPRTATKRKATATPPAEMAPIPEVVPAKASTGRKHSNAAPLPPLAEAILMAIQEGKAVEFIFADAETNAPRTFEPRHLLFDALSLAWYAWGWDRRYNAERHHRVDLLAEVNAVEGVGRAAQGPYAEGTPANQIGGWLGGEPIAVKALLLKQWVFAVKQAPPAFPKFQIEDQGDGQALVTFLATDLRAIARWAMQFGDGLQVLEPARLVDRIKQVGAVWAGRDRQAPPPPAAKPRPEPAPEPRHSEPRPPREHRPDREREEAPKAKPAKVEVIRFDRL